MSATLELSVLEHTDLLIAGKPRPTADRITVLDPATGAEIAAVAAGTHDDVDDAVDAARSAQRAWARRPPRERGQVLFELARLIRANAEELSRLESIDTGKPLSQAATDVEVAAQYFEFYGGLADKLYGETIPLGGANMAFTIREPLGVSAIIIPWNYPLQIGCRGLAPCLMTGNGVVLKPAEEAPLSAIALGGLALQAGVPAGLFNIVTGLGPVVGDHLAAHEGINQISFTGSVETGSKVMHRAADHVIPVLLELGGKSPSIVFADADLDTVIPVLTKACTQNAGQTCSAAARAVVLAPAYDQVVDRLASSFAAMGLGRGLDDPDMGPLISAHQRRVVADYVEIGRAAGASVAAGGAEASIPGLEGGFFYRPTVLAEVTPDARVAQEEIFGPVLAVIKADDEAHAVEIADGTDFGLVSSVWTRDLNTAMRVAQEIDQGQVYINSYGAAGGVPLPFGGYKKSGFGREKGVEGVFAYTQTKTVVLNVPAS